MFDCGYRCHRSSGTRLDLRVMLLLQGFDSLLQVAAGFDQVLVGFLQLVLVQVELRLGDIQLVLQRVLLRLIGLRECTRELVHPLLIGVAQSLRNADALLDLQRLGTQRGRMRFNIAQRGREGEGERVVGDPQGRLREGLFLGSVGQPRQALRGGVGALVHQFRSRQRRGALFGHLGGGRRGLPPREAGRREQQHQDEGRYFLHGSHSLCGGGMAGATWASAACRTSTCSKREST